MVIRPLSNAPTMFMPELHATEPLHVVMLCGWCGIRLAAVPEDPVAWRGRAYHPPPARCLEGAQLEATA